MQKSNYLYQIVRPFVNCPVQLINFGTGSNQWFENPAVSSGIVVGARLTTTDTMTVPAMFFEYQTQIFACDSRPFNFRQRIALTGGAAVTDAANVSSVCISNPNDNQKCLFEWRHAQDKWSLWQRDIPTDTLNKVYDMPIGPKPKFDLNTTFTFSMKNGMVLFYVDSDLYWVFRGTWMRNYSIKVTPPPANYSQGIEPF